jgi:precorrin-3B synthase
MNARVPLLLRRGACPGLSAPMPTGDGLLVRLVPADSISPDAFIALCAAARAHGNGTMEVTARGSLQVRGLTPASAPLFASEVARLDIAASDGVAVLAGPLRDDADAIIDTNSLAVELRQAIAHAHLALAPKVSVVFDGGGCLHFDALDADIRLRAIGSASAPRLLVALGRLLAPSPQLPDPYIPAEPVSYGTAPLLPLPACGVRGPIHALRLAARPPHPARESAPTSPRTRGEVLVSSTAPRLPPPEGGRGSWPPVWLGAIAPERAVDVVLGLLKEIAAHGPSGRAADVTRARGIDALRSKFDVTAAAPPTPRRPAEMVGRHRLRGGSLALGLALAFGHAQADALQELARLAAAHGARSIRPAPDRALMLIGIPPGEASALVAAAGQLGFVVSAGDPRRRIAACPGAPACASGFNDARRLAAELAPQLAGLRDGIAVHVSGCAKGCAHQAPAALTVVGTAHGCGIIRNGTARAMPRYHVAPAGLAAEVARAFPDGEAARVFPDREAVDG